MATYVPAKRATEYIFYIGLVSQSTGQFQANPTLAAGDVKISKDGGALANLATLPAVTPAASKLVKVTVSDTEMTADNVAIVFSDAAGAEWDDVIVNIQTSARQIDDLAYPTTSGRSIDVDASGGIEVGSFQAGAITAAAIATNAIEADALAADAVTEIWAGSTAPTAATIADAVWDETSTGHTDAGKAGEQLWTDIDAILVDTGTTLQGELDGIQADTENIQTRLPASLSGDGFIKADLLSIGDELVSGNNATLKLKQLDITNPLGAAVKLFGAVDDGVVIIESTGGSSVGVLIRGDGFGSGVVIYGGADASGMEIDGGANGSNPGMYVVGYGTQPGILVQSVSGVSVDVSNDIAVSDGNLTLANIKTSVWSQVIETGFTALQSMRLMLSALAGKLSGAATTTVTIRDVNDTKNRITATVDSDGNRTSTTLDGS